MFPLPLDVTIQPSRMLRRGVLLLHLMATGALLLAALAPPARLAGLLWLTASLFLLWRRPGTRVRLRGKADGTLETWRDDKGWQPVGLHADAFVLPRLTVLGLCRPGQRRPEHLLILPDSLAADDFRRLRVWLRWLGAKNDGKTADSSTTWAG